ncbi:F1 complex, delta/epsilon subunit of ATPase [Naematelia encephala]|uniref:ATP synthase subunit delta, mitochondrial n=1 Tax=Naematelia encephala TaxID=71784 RepID=A0A1Y2BDD8_9TREE|nr:F1 complex, delta/epsilon subunit of ATPase [Naematelia encephala]
MLSSRVAPALRSLPRASVIRSARRGYADVQDGKLQLSLVLPHQSIYSSTGVIQVNIPAATGDMGILANHVASVEALRPGVIEVIEDSGSKKWFASAGFATVHNNNTLTINAVEAYPLDKFSAEAIRNGLADANRLLSSSASEKEKAEARIEVDVFEGLQAALSK